jgi:flagellar protein FliS
MNGYNQYQFKRAGVNQGTAGNVQFKRAEETVSPVQAANFNQNKYQKTAVNTADPGKLVVMLYDGAVKYLLNAIDGIKEKDVEKKCNNVNRAYDIIQELQFALDMEQGGEIALNLYRLYQFMMTHLIKAKINKDGITMIQEVIDMMRKLNEAWRAITAEKKPAPNAAPVAGKVNTQSASYGNRTNTAVGGGRRIAV